MKFIHTADLHIGKKLNGEDRNPEIESALNEIIEYTKNPNNQIDFLVISGDVFDYPNPSAESEKIAFNFFYKLNLLNKKCYIISGNHDSDKRFEAFKQILEQINIYVSGEFDGNNFLKNNIFEFKKEETEEKVAIVCLPYLSKIRTYKNENINHINENYQSRIGLILDYFAEELNENYSEHHKILLMHLTMTGAKNSQNQELDKITQTFSHNKISTIFDYVALGHIHKPQEITKKPPTYYSGSIIQMDFGERTDEKGFYVVTLDKKENYAKNEFIKFQNNKQLKIIDIDVNQLEDNLIKAKKDNTNKKYIYKFIIHNDGRNTLDIAKIIRKYFSSRHSFVIKGTRKIEKRKENSHSNKELIELYEEYLKTKNEKLNEKEKKAFKEAEELVNTERKE